MTRYWVDVRYTLTGHVRRLSYATMTARELAIIALSPWAVVLARGVEAA